MNGLDKPEDNDLEILEADFLLEEGDIKLTGYQTRLHDILNWLHMETVSRLAKEITYPNQIIDKIGDSVNSDHLIPCFFDQLYNL